MESVKLLQEIPNKQRNKKKTAPKEPSIQDDLLSYFPLPRYFQVHFRHIHDNVQLSQHELKTLKDALARMEQKIDKLMTLFSDELKLEGDDS